MNISAEILRRLSALKLPAKAFAEVLDILADALAAEELRLEKQRARKRKSRDAERDEGVTVTGPERDKDGDKATVVSSPASPFDGSPTPLPINTPSLPPSKKISRATRLSEDWWPSLEDATYAQSKGLSQAEISTEAEKFRNHWLSKSGKDAAKTRWDLTWQNWILNAIE